MRTSGLPAVPVISKFVLSPGRTAEAGADARGGGSGGGSGSGGGGGSSGGGGGEEPGGGEREESVAKRPRVAGAEEGGEGESTAPEK